MAGIVDVSENLFPLRDISAVVRLFKQQLESTSEPDLTLLSIVVGAVENSLTCGGVLTTDKGSEEADGEIEIAPVEYHIVRALHTKFHAIIKGAVDVTHYDNGTPYATRELVKKVSDVIWNSLTRSFYKDRAHLQSLYSYLTGKKLDCFGVALAVVAACQVLGYSDVHLALSEDHAWVVFGEDGTETAEVTWHGKGNEDKRGQPVGGELGSRSWLYVNGCPVICTRHMEVAAMVSSINPTLNATSDIIEVSVLQQQLLWLLYDLGHLTLYPMALGNLGDLEEVNPTEGRPPCIALFKEATACSKNYYKNQHVYPYTYQGGYYFRKQMYKEALESWANAGDVIRQYNYSRDDEEIYKEFLEIANDCIPCIIKSESSGHSARSILKDAECFAHLLRFYDGICQWEEGSQTPVLHIGWATPLVHAISKFDSEVRAKIIVDEKDGSKTSDNRCEFLNNNYCKTPKERLEVEENDSKLESLHPGIAALVAACGDNLLNPKFLLQGGGEPFVENTSSDISLNGHEAGPSKTCDEEECPTPETEPGRLRLALFSQKMKGLKELLLAEKLNTHAISLQLTAQSQVQVGRKSRGALEGDGSRPKRSRRE